MTSDTHKILRNNGFYYSYGREIFDPTCEEFKSNFESHPNYEADSQKFSNYLERLELPYFEFMYDWTESIDHYISPKDNRRYSKLSSIPFRYVFPFIKMLELLCLSDEGLYALIKDYYDDYKDRRMDLIYYRTLINLQKRLQ